MVIMAATATERGASKVYVYEAEPQIKTVLNNNPAEVKIDSVPIAILRSTNDATDDGTFSYRYVTKRLLLIKYCNALNL